MGRHLAAAPFNEGAETAPFLVGLERDVHGLAVARATRFEVTEDHLRLLRRTFVGWDDSAYHGAPAVGIKRPYGNSDVVTDLAEIIVPVEGDDELDDYASFTREGELKSVRTKDGRELTQDDLLRLHREMELVLQILASNLEIAPGLYLKTRMYDSLSWRRVEGRS